MKTTLKLMLAGILMIFVALFVTATITNALRAHGHKFPEAQSAPKEDYRTVTTAAGIVAKCGETKNIEVNILKAGSVWSPLTKKQVLMTMFTQSLFLDNGMKVQVLQTDPDGYLQIRVISDKNGKMMTTNTDGTLHAADGRIGYVCWTIPAYIKK